MSDEQEQNNRNEEQETETDHSTPPNRSETDNNANSSVQSVISYMSERKVDSLLWLTRMCTIIFTIGYIIPLFSNPYSCYQKVLISNAATSALRLHQRVPHLQLSRQFLGQLLMEDSCHYLLYALIFIYNYPIPLVLLPVLMFAFLHSTNFSLILLEKFGMRTSRFASLLGNFVQQHQRTILKMIALSEIVLMPFTILMLFTGKISLLTPFIYYRFLTMRYSSLRNPYTRNVFYELRCITEIQIQKPGCPVIIGNVFRKAIDFIIRLAPPTVQQ